jgi:predicted ATPase
MAPPQDQPPAEIVPLRLLESTSSPTPVNRQPSSNLTLPRNPRIGREREVAAIQHLLLQEQVGLLTLTGPGGIGKTRLALQVAANLLDHFVDGAYFVALAPIRDPDLVSAAIAQTLGVREASGRSMQESLQEHLRDKQLLLVLDNFEQILAAAPLVSALLNECRRLKVLVTSRATLHLYGEQEFPVPLLALPDAKHLTATALNEFAAIEPFCQRARAVKPDFVLTTDNAAAVAQICIGLDGLPLAIELAAARLKLFSPAALLSRLNQRLALLTGGPHDLPARQRTLRDEIAWSYDLLTPDEQTLFRRLCVFVGGFTLEAAKAVGNPSAGSGQVLSVDVLDGVATLVDHNLLKQSAQTGDEARFDMLETIREYGLEQLHASQEVQIICQHHAHFYLRQATVAEPELLGPKRTHWLEQLAMEHDNLRAVLAWSLATVERSDLGLQLMGSLTWFWFFGGHISEARSWFTAMLKRASPPSAARVQTLWGAGLMALIQGDHPAAYVTLTESVTIGRQIADKRGVAVALRELGLVLLYQDDPVAAYVHRAESVAISRTVDSPWDLALALHNLAHVVNAQVDPTTACTLFAESHRLFLAVEDAWGISNVLIGLGLVAGQQGDYATARTHLAAALPQTDKWTAVEVLNLLGEVVQRQGELDLACDFYAGIYSAPHRFDRHFSRGNVSSDDEWTVVVRQVPVKFYAA